MSYMYVCVDIDVYVINSPYSFSSLLKCSVRIGPMYMFTVEPEWKARLSLHLSTRMTAQVSPSSLYLDQRAGLIFVLVPQSNDRLYLR